MVLVVFEIHSGNLFLAGSMGFEFWRFIDGTLVFWSVKVESLSPK